MVKIFRQMNLKFEAKIGPYRTYSFQSSRDCLFELDRAKDEKITKNLERIIVKTKDSLIFLLTFPSFGIMLTLWNGQRIHTL